MCNNSCTIIIFEAIEPIPAETERLERTIESNREIMNSLIENRADLPDLKSTDWPRVVVPSIRNKLRNLISPSSDSRLSKMKYCSFKQDSKLVLCLFVVYHP